MIVIYHHRHVHQHQHQHHNDAQAEEPGGGAGEEGSKDLGDGHGAEGAYSGDHDNGSNDGDDD